MNKTLILEKITTGEINPFPLNSKSRELLIQCLTSDVPWCDVYLETLVEQGVLPVVG